MSTDPAKALAALLKKLAARYPAAAPEPLNAGLDEGVDPMLNLYVQSFLVWDASTGQARAAMKRLRETFVDFNELRIAFADEIAAAFGERYPRGYERALRLRSGLHDIFRREHSLSLSRLSELSKREARGYLESLDGTPAYVASRVFLFGLGGHAMPVDQRIADLLAGEAILGDDVTDAESAAAWLERQVRAGDGVHVGSLLQAWSDDEGATPKRERRPDVPVFAPPDLTEPVPDATPQDTKAKKVRKKSKTARKSSRSAD